MGSYRLTIGAVTVNDIHLDRLLLSAFAISGVRSTSTLASSLCTNKYGYKENLMKFELYN